MPRCSTIRRNPRGAWVFATHRLAFGQPVAGDDEGAASSSRSSAWGAMRSHMAKSSRTGTSGLAQWRSRRAHRASRAHMLLAGPAAFTKRTPRRPPDQIDRHRDIVPDRALGYCRRALTPESPLAHHRTRATCSPATSCVAGVRGHETAFAANGCTRVSSRAVKEQHDRLGAPTERSRGS